MLLQICDHTGPADLKAVKYNEEKTLHWLAFKCDKLITKLEEQKIYVEGGAKSETYVKSEKLQTDPDLGNSIINTNTMLFDVVNVF